MNSWQLFKKVVKGGSRKKFNGKHLIKKIIHLIKLTTIKLQKTNSITIIVAYFKIATILCLLLHS